MADLVEDDTGSSSDSTPGMIPSVPSPPLSVESPLPKRRNGKPQSCEPCRIAKVSCDHDHPKCGRCVKKGIVSQCIYHPAPLTRPSDGPTSGGVHKRRSSASKKPSSNNIAASNLLLLLSQQRSTDHGTATEQTEEYLGPTNYTAVFRETQPHIAADLWRKDRDQEQIDTPVLMMGSATACSVTAMNIGIEVLAKFPDRTTSDRLFSQYARSCEFGIHGPTLAFGLRQFWSMWGPQLRARNYRAIAEKLLSTPPNSMRTSRTSADWVQSFTGENLRFELVGLFLAVFSIASMTLPTWDPLFEIEKHGRVGKKLIAAKYGEAAGACIEVCTGQAVATESLIWLLHSVQITQSQYKGDDDGFLWHKSGQVATAITSFGLHRQAFIDASPFMVAELRRRVFASAYVSDKQLSTYTGRPPRLSKRFCNCQLPMDLSDDELTAEGEQLETILAALDKDGWNTDGQWRSAVIMRLLMLSSMIREEVLELCLGPSANVSRARKQELKQRAEDVYLNVPSRFHLSDDDNKIIATPGENLCTQIMFHMEHIFNCFLIERLPTSGETDNTDELIRIALQMLDQMAFVQRYRDKLVEWMYGQGWWVVYYAVPAASVLSVELLKQHQYPRQYKSNLPRARVIRALSVYLINLVAVGPEEGNYKICQRMHKIVERILDEVLEIQLQDNSITPQTTPGTSSTLPDIDLAAVMGPNDDPEFMDWLQTVDWTKAPWMDPMGGF